VLQPKLSKSAGSDVRKERKKRPRLLPALLAAGLLLGGCAALDQQQRRWIFQPSDRTWWGGASTSLDMQDVWIDFRSLAENEAVKLHGLWLPREEPGAPVLLYLHGARWDVRSSAGRMRRMHELGFSVLGIDYRGFGQSTKTLPSETLASEDARAAWDWLAQQHPQAQRYLFGHSLGGAIAVKLAADVNDEAGLIVEGTFPSIADVFSSMRWGWLPLGPLITQRFDAASRIGDVGAPVLVVHGSEDQLISPELGRALFDKAREPKRFVLVPGGSHHNANELGQVQYKQALGDLFKLNSESAR
jgi:alpha-beta hydrolase superfamily lysophospholipase